MILPCKTILGWGKITANKVNFDLTHAPGAGLITRPVDLQPSALPLCYSCPELREWRWMEEHEEHIEEFECISAQEPKDYTGPWLILSCSIDSNSDFI